ncbi:MAG: GIY-YIG nuclease family protein [Nitrospira sp.]|nr:GIY-YIG nuclease family protein [Nitrospira sp.]
MPIDKAHIIGEIRRIAKANGGKAPGSHALKSQSGIKKSDWYPHIWLRWSDALMEAGYAPNQFQSRTSDELLMQAYTGLIRELGRVPIEGEIRRKAKDDKNFPSHTSFSRFGKKEELIDAAAQFCAKRTDLNDVLSILERRERPSRKSPALDPDAGSNVTTGFVYLMKSGPHYKIGRTNSVGRRTSELAIKIPIPPKTIHHIETDDPVGVESYWHKRFEEKRGEGEWFNLSAEDVKAFKRWKRIV